MFIWADPVHPEPALAVGGGADDLEGGGFAGIEQRAGYADGNNAVALLGVVFHSHITHSHFAVRAVPRLVVESNVEIQPAAAGNFIALTDEAKLTKFMWGVKNRKGYRVILTRLFSDQSLCPPVIAVK